MNTLYEKSYADAIKLAHTLEAADTEQFWYWLTDIKSSKRILRRAFTKAEARRRNLPLRGSAREWLREIK